MDLAMPFEPNPTVPTLICGLPGQDCGLSSLGSARRALADEQAIWLLRSDGQATPSTVRDLALEGVEALFLPAVEPEAAERSLAGLRQLVHRLRAPGGCPWD